MHRLVASFLVVATCASFAPSALAADPVETADALFQSARQAMARGDYLLACGQFTRSLRLDPAAGTLLNLADCEERLGRLTKALEHFQAGRAKLAADDFRVSFTEGRIAALSRRVARVIVHSDDETLQVTCDGALLQNDVPVVVDPGKRVLAVRASERTVRRLTVELAEGETRTVDLAAPVVGESDASRSNGPKHVPWRAPARRTVGFVFGGIGVVGLGIGAVTGAMAIDAASTYKDHCRADGACDAAGLAAASKGRSVSLVSPVMLGIGAAATAFGIYLLATPSTSVSVSARGITLERAF